MCMRGGCGGGGGDLAALLHCAFYAPPLVGILCGMLCQAWTTNLATAHDSSALFDGYRQHSGVPEARLFKARVACGAMHSVGLKKSATAQTEKQSLQAANLLPG